MIVQDDILKDWNNANWPSLQYLEGSNVESVEVTEEAVKGMSGPTFYYAEVGWNLSFWWLQNLVFFQEQSEESSEGQEDLKRATA